MLRSEISVRTAVQPRVSGKDVRHDEFDICIVFLLCLQECVNSGEIRIDKRKGEHNTADFGTKAVSAPVLRKHFENVEDGVARRTTPSALSAAL